MESNLTQLPQILAAGAMLVPVISGLLTEVVKRSIFSRRNADGELVVTQTGQRALPIIAVVLGVAGGLVYLPGSTALQVIGGLVLGLTAIGGQDFLKKVTSRSSQT